MFVLPRSAAGRGLLGLLAALAAWRLLAEQGARIGPWRCAFPGPSWLFPSVVAAAFLLAPAVAARLPPRRAAVLSMLLVALAWPVDAGRARTLTPSALHALVHRPSAGGGAERAVRLSSLNLPGRAAFRSLLGRNEDVGLTFDLWVLAPGSGRHRFELLADDGATLRVDGQPVLQAAGTASADVALPAGVHRLRLQHRQTTGPAALTLGWDRPAFVELFPLEFYAADRPELAAPGPARRRTAIAVLALAAKFSWWVAFLALVLAAAERKSAFWRERGRPALQALRRRLDDPLFRTAAATGVAAACLLLAVEAAVRPQAEDGFHLQPWSSEYLMQTVSAADLRDEPLRSLFYLHIQPPALDALRGAAAWAHGGDGEVLLRAVDAVLYVAWAGAFGLLVALVCRWVGLLSSRPAGVAAAAAFAVSPAALFYATTLDGTFLSAALLTWFFYELWRCRIGPASSGRLAAAIVALFLTRSVFQWPFLAVTGVSLLLLGWPWRRCLRVLGVAGLVMAVYIAKQYALFGLTLTSSFAADSFCKGLAAYCEGKTPVARPELPDPSAARVLSRVKKLDGQYNYNQLAFLRLSFSKMAEYRALLRSQPVSQTLAAWAHNFSIWLEPSSSYSRNALVDRLPWRVVYDRAFSGLPLVALMAAGALLWWRSTAREGAPPGRYREAAALVLPASYVLTVTVIFEGGENMRYKFFLEPALFVLLAVQVAWLAARLRSAVRGRPPRVA